MSATPQPSAPATQAPNQIAFLWERYRSIAYVVVFAILAAVGINFFMKQQHRSQLDAEWSSFATTLGFEKIYASKDDLRNTVDSLAIATGSSLAGIDMAKLESALASGSDTQKPYLLLAIARKAIAEKQWQRAQAAIDQLDKSFPEHVLVKASEYPVQTRTLVKRDDDKPLPPGKKPELKPAVKGSASQLLKEELAKAQLFAAPAQFAKPEIPADAVRVKFETSQGAIVIALMPQAPLHRDAFLKLVEQTPPFWETLAVDEVRRSTKTMKQPMELHLGFESSKEEDRSKWNVTDPSKNQVEFESNDLGHFAGAVAGRLEADGKSCVDRLWICAEDNFQEDGERVVFGYVVEGLDILKRICELPLTGAQEEERGQGRPQDSVRVTKVSRL